jgi:hypothetical protein
LIAVGLLGATAAVVALVLGLELRFIDPPAMLGLGLGMAGIGAWQSLVGRGLRRL